METQPKKPCPNFPYFGAPYPDAGCIDGFLFDLDDCDDEGNLYNNEENIPCPFCNTDAFIDFHTDLDEAQLKEMDEDESLSPQDKADILSCNHTKADATQIAARLKERYL